MTPNDEGIRAIDQDEHNADAHAKRVVQRYQNPADGVWYNYNPLGGVTERYDYDDSTTIYTAYAPVGTSEGSTGWTITKYNLTDTNNASGKIAVDVSWTNRASGTYS